MWFANHWFTPTASYAKADVELPDPDPLVLSLSKDVGQGASEGRRGRATGASFDRLRTSGGVVSAR